jgi:hypothetical protein
MFRVVDGEAVILDLDSGEYYGLNLVGTRVWQLIVEHASFALICELLLQEFDIDQETLQSDVADLLTDLLTHGLLLREPD